MPLAVSTPPVKRFGGVLSVAIDMLPLPALVTTAIPVSLCRNATAVCLSLSVAQLGERCEITEKERPTILSNEKAQQNRKRQSASNGCKRQRQQPYHSNISITTLLTTPGLTLGLRLRARIAQKLSKSEAQPNMSFI